MDLPTRGRCAIDTLALFQRLGLALAIGLLIGVERGWQEQGGPDGSRIAGIRTFALVGLLGGVWGALYPAVGGWALGLAALGFALGFAAFQWRETASEKTLSATGLLAGLVTFSLGVYAILGSMAVAGAAGVIAAALLAERETLHNLIKRVSWPELRAALLLLAMTFVLLPVLPDRAVDPWGALNPYRLWLMTILIAAFSYAGYVAIKVAGARRGLLYAGAVGGVVTSTAVTLAFSRTAKDQPAAAMEVAVGIAAAWTVSLVRMLILATIVAPVLFLPLVAPVAAASAVLAVAAFAFNRRAATSGTEPRLVLDNPFQISLVLRFGLLLAVVTLAAKLLSTHFGQQGLYPLAALSGLADEDPITLSAAQMAGSGFAVPAAAGAILIAAASNIVSKTAIAFVLGGARLGLALGLAGIAALAAGAAVFVAGW
ncbi:MAG: MgtC/SapB family protein [Rhizomicrobium sp.]